jgi:hypothetical protein
MFQPYMIIIRLPHKKENKYRVALRNDTSVLYICTVYSGISIYWPRNVRFPVFTMRHLWSRIKFHVNNVIYICTHRSPNCRFSAFIVCKSRSQHSISHMDFLAWFVWEKNLKRAIYVGSVLHTSATCGRLYVCVQSTRIYLRYIIFASHVTFSFESLILALFCSLTMALRN